MSQIEQYNAIDDLILNVSRKVKPLYYIEPINLNDEKEAFFNGLTKNPKFIYKELEYNPDDVEKELRELIVPEGSFKQIYNDKIKHISLENELIKNRGDEEITKNNSIQIHGIPSDELILQADKILRETNLESQRKTMSAKELQRALNNALNEHELFDWTCELDDKKLTTIYAADKKITVCKDRYFSENDIERLKVHEIGVHVLRSANGYTQPLKVFATGLPGYLSTEEGLTTYFEEITNTTDYETLKNYAARVIAIESVVENMTFKDTFDMLKSYDLDNEVAWNLGVRAHRGGGYIKDHVYLEGLLKIRTYAQKNPDFETLFAGKIGLEDIAFTKNLINEGVLKKPKYLPKFL